MNESMNGKLKPILGILLFILLLAGAYGLYQNLSKDYKPQNQTPAVQKSTDAKKTQDTTEATTEPETSKAPDFTVYDKEGNQVTLSSFLGKPVVVNFWASWCDPCKSEMPEFNEVYKSLENDEVVFMMIDLADGIQETQEDGQNFVDQQGFEFPVYFDLDQNAAATYGINSIPTTFFIDKDGNIVTYQKGTMNKESLLAGIDLIN